MMLTQVPHAVLEETDPAKKIHAYYIIGEDPAQSDPNLAEVRETLSNIEFVIVQDIFFNKTCEYADVIFLPRPGANTTRCTRRATAASSASASSSNLRTAA